MGNTHRVLLTVGLLRGHGGRHRQQSVVPHRIQEDHVEYSVQTEPSARGAIVQQSMLAGLHVTAAYTINDKARGGRKVLCVCNAPRVSYTLAAAKGSLRCRKSLSTWRDLPEQQQHHQIKSQYILPTVDIKAPPHAVQQHTQQLRQWPDEPGVHQKMSCATVPVTWLGIYGTELN